MLVPRIILLFGLLWAPMAFANTLLDARQHLENGEFDAAIDIALNHDSPEGLVLAAETLSTKVMLGYVEDYNKSAQKARKWAEEAYEALPNSQEALVQYALAYGFETRSSSPFRAWRKRLPRKTMDVIQEVKTRYPEDPRGDALFGAWHLGIVRKAGAKRGASMFDADEALGVEGYEKALQAAPNDVVIGSNYAVTILALDLDTYFDRGVEILEHIVSVKAQNAVELEIQTRIRALLSVSDDKIIFGHAVIDLIDKGTLPANATETE